MRRILHACWPLAAVVAFTAALALQIPRKALFFRAVALERPAPFASFTEFGAAEYAAIMQKVRMSWQMRSHGAGALAESQIGVLDLGEESQPPEPLELPGSFFAHHALEQPAAAGRALARHLDEASAACAARRHCRGSTSPRSAARTSRVPAHGP